MIKDQKDVTILGLEYLQESGRKNALESLLEERDDEYQTALADFNTSPKRVQVICTQPMICGIKCHT